MISEGSCDIKDWGNDAENVALSSQETITFKNILNGKNVVRFQNITVFFIK